MYRLYLLPALLCSLFIAVDRASAQRLRHLGGGGRQTAVTGTDLETSSGGATSKRAGKTPPSVIRVLGANQDLYVILSNEKKAQDKVESSIAVKLKPFEEGQLMEIRLFAVERNGHPMARTRLAAPPAIPLRKQGASLPVTLEMKEGENVICDLLFLLNGRERGKTRIRIDHQGLAFAPEEKADAQKQ